MDFAISYGTYYSYLRPEQNRTFCHNIEADVKKFADGEMEISFPDSIRGKHIFIFGDTTNNAMELFLTIDAARRNSACKITVVCPTFGYARQDKKGTGRVSMGASMISHVLQSLGVNQMIAIDLHADQIIGGFQIPFEHLSGLHLFEETIEKLINPDFIQGDQEYVFCSPDAGGTGRVNRFVKKFNLPMVTMSKHRDKPNSVESMTLLGDVKGKTVILIDDMVDTGGTLAKAVQTLKDMGALDVFCLITHPILSGNAIEKLKDVKLITTNTRDTVNHGNHHFQIVDCSAIIHQAIYNITQDRSILTTLS